MIALEVGAILFIRLVVYRKSFWPPNYYISLSDKYQDIQSLPEPVNSECNILSESICRYVLRDTFTVVLSIWTGLQLMWVSMLMIVQLVQIARGVTTYENMRGHMHGSSQAAEAITSALTAGSTSLDGAQLTGAGMGSNPATLESHRPHRQKEGCFATWKKLLGLDSFVATATGGLEGGNRRRRGNPYSRGIITNCRDFWCDPAPYFGKRQNGMAMLGGDVVNYTRMYETPPRMKLRRPQQDGDGGMYHSLGTEEPV